MDDVLDAPEVETGGLAPYLERLTVDEWRSPSACAGWSVSDFELHLAQPEESVIASFDQGSAGIPACDSDGYLSPCWHGHLLPQDCPNTGSMAWISASPSETPRPLSPGPRPSAM